MYPVNNLYYRLYSGHAPATSKSALPNYSNLSAIDVDNIPPPYTVKNITQFILKREQETDAEAELYLDPRDPKPAAADTIIDILDGASTQPRMAIRVVLQPQIHRAVKGSAQSDPVEKELVHLFPNPGPALTEYSPIRWPGITANSTNAVRQRLADDFNQHDAFFNYRLFHNHTPFHLLTAWALGGSTPLLEAIWKQHLAVEQPAFESPGPISEDSYTDHLGDPKYYQAYLAFFAGEVLRIGVNASLHKWIFSPEANFDDTKGYKQQPEMMSRLLAGVLHPLLYTGFGLEFSLPGLVAEGLAQTAVHVLIAENALLPQEMFTASATPKTGTHAFSIAARILRDSRFANNKGSFNDVLTKYGKEILQYTSEWTVDGDNPKELADKIRELSFLNVMFYAVGGSKSKGFETEFTLMHLVTSSLMLPSYIAVLTSPTSKSLLLRAYLAHSLGFYITRGRPSLDVRSFFAVAPLDPATPGPVPTPSCDAFPNPTSTEALTPNPWLQIVQSTLVHPDGHVCKVVRALAHYASMYGEVVPGEFRYTELDGSASIDGSLFVRAANLTLKGMGWVREGETAQYWANDPNHEGSTMARL